MNRKNPGLVTKNSIEKKGVLCVGLKKQKTSNTRVTRVLKLEYDVRGQEAALLSVLMIAVASAEGGGRVSVSTRVRLVFLLL